MLSAGNSVAVATSKFRWRDVPRAIWYFLDDEKAKFVVAFIFLFLVFFYELVPAYVAGKIIDFFAHFHVGDSLKTFYVLIGFLGVSIPLAAIIRIECRKVIQFSGYRMRARSRVIGFEKLAEFSMQWHAQENSGNKIQRIFTGSLALKEWTRIISGDLLSVGAWMTGIVVIFFVSNIWLGVFVSAYVAAFIGIEWYYNKKMVRLSDDFNRMDQKAGGVYIESTGNMLALKALGSAQTMASRVNDTERQARDLGILKSRTGFIKWQIFRIVDGPAVIVFFLILGHGLIQGMFTAGTVLVLFSYFIKLSYEVRGRLSDIDESIIDLKSGLGNMMPIFWEATHVPTGKEKFPHDWHSIVLDDAAMSYPSGQVGLHNLNLEIRRGAKLGIAGSSGGGKSTLAKVLLGLYKIQSGEFHVNQLSYYDISHDDLLKHVSVVLQETELFNMSLQDNITMMRDVDEKLLAQAIDISQLGEVISHLPEGLETLIGERGYMLSGGERQRLGIARAIYKNSEIMILDEATSSLDSETERKITERLFGEFGKGRTMILVAHRLATLASTDRVAVFEGGTIVEEGKYGDLLDNKNSAFALLNKAQDRL